MRLELLNKDAVVLTFDYDAENHRVTGIHALVSPEYAPPSMVAADGTVALRDLSYWWEHRGIPASRNQIDRLAESLDLDRFATIVLLERSLGLSLSDRYWVRPEGSGMRWRDVNFFDNDFSDDLGRLALVPPLDPSAVDASSLDLMDPASSVGGNLPKKWIADGQGTRWLVKSGSAHFRQDVFNEVAACSLYERLLAETEYIPYRIVYEDGIPYSACPNMLGEDEELVSAADLLRPHERESEFGSYAHCVRTLCGTGIPRESIIEALSKMFSCDFLIANADRHTGNFGLIRNCVTLEYTRVAPIFDSGTSFWCWAYSLKSPADYEYTPRPFLGRPSESRMNQLRLFDSYGWLDDVDLSPWVDDVVAALSEDELMPESRVDAVAQGIERNISLFERHVEKMAALFPERAPKWILEERASLDGLEAEVDRVARVPQQPHRPHRGSGARGI